MNVQELLKIHFEKKQKEYDYYSLRLLAKRTGISPSYLSLMFSGKRKLQLKYLEPICSALDLDRETRNDIYFQFIQENGDSKAQKVYQGEVMKGTSDPNKIAPQNRKKLNILTPWYNLAVLDATLLKNFDGSPEWISEKLGLGMDEVSLAVEELLKAELLEISSGRLKKVERRIEFRSAQTPEVLREHHMQYMDVAKEVLKSKTSTDEQDERLISGMTFAVSKKKAQEIKSRLNSLLIEILDEAELDPDTSEVYRLSFQFFPIK